jgi:hypothetical protein
MTTDMTIALYSLKIRSKRDVLLARLRARQLTRLLGYAEQDQLLLAAAAFELAWSTFQDQRRVVLHYTLEQDRFRIWCARPERKEEEEERRAFDRAWNGPTGERRRAKRTPDAFAELALRLEKPLPVSADPMPIEDIAWSMQQLAQHTPLNLFEEIHQYNLELLRLAGDQRGRREEPEAPRRAGAAA